MLELKIVDNLFKLNVYLLNFLIFFADDKFFFFDNRIKWEKVDCSWGCYTYTVYPLFCCISSVNRKRAFYLVIFFMCTRYFFIYIFGKLISTKEKQFKKKKLTTKKYVFYNPIQNQLQNTDVNMIISQTNVKFNIGSMGNF